MKKSVPILFALPEEVHKEAKKIANDNNITYKQIFYAGMEYVKEAEKKCKIDLKTYGRFKAYLSFNITHSISHGKKVRVERPRLLNIFNNGSKRCLEVNVINGSISDSGKSFRFIYSFYDPINGEEVTLSNTMPLRHVRNSVLNILGLGDKK